MKDKLLIFIFLTILFLYGNAVNANAQDGTFGPICEEGVTCTPTSTASQPQPTLPVTGTTETTFAILGLGSLIFLAGGTGIISFNLAKKSN